MKEESAFMKLCSLQREQAKETQKARGRQTRKVLGSTGPALTGAGQSGSEEVIQVRT